MALANKKLYFENVRAGDELAPLARPAVERVTIVRYAGAAEDFNPVHVDEDYAKRSGFPGTFAHGMLPMGWLGQYATDWARGGNIRRLSARFVKIVWPGDQLTCRGRVADKRREGGEYYVDLDLWIENHKGELVVKGAATARLFHSPEDEDRQRRGLPALIVDEGSRPTLADVFEREMSRAGMVVQPAPAAAAPKKAPPARVAPAAAEKAHRPSPRPKPAAKPHPKSKVQARRPAAARAAKRRRR